MRSPLLIIGIFFTIVGLFIGSIFLIINGLPWRDWQLDRSGIQTQADVTYTEIDYNTSYNRRHPWRIAYTFLPTGKTSADDTIEGSATTFKTSQEKAARESKKVGIEYLPNNPAVNRLVGEKRSLFGILIYLPFVFVALGIGMISVGVRR